MEQDTNTQVPEQPQAVPGLTLQDLRILAGSVELGAQRGAFRASEMEIIGATYNKLAEFLKATTPAPTEAAAEEAPVTEAPAEVTE
jgi:hypothetical protein